MKETLSSISFLPKFVLFLYTLLVLFVTRIVFSHVFLLQNMRKKSKMWLVHFPTFIAITRLQKLRGVQKYFLIVCVKIKGVEINETKVLE